MAARSLSVCVFLLEHMIKSKWGERTCTEQRVIYERFECKVRVVVAKMLLSPHFNQMALCSTCPQRMCLVKLTNFLDSFLLCQWNDSQAA